MNQELFKSAIGTLVRHLITILSSFLIAKLVSTGIVDTGQATELVGLVLAIMLNVAWAFAVKKRLWESIVIALDLQPGSSIDDVKAIQKANDKLS